MTERQLDGVFARYGACATYQDTGLFRQLIDGVEVRRGEFATAFQRAPFHYRLTVNERGSAFTREHGHAYVHRVIVLADANRVRFASSSHEERVEPDLAVALQLASLFGPSFDLIAEALLPSKVPVWRLIAERSELEVEEDRLLGICVSQSHQVPVSLLSREMRTSSVRSETTFRPLIDVPVPSSTWVWDAPTVSGRRDYN